MKEHNSYKYACLFGGGAIRGIAHIGVIKALNELGIAPTTIVGSSVGSIMATLYAIGYTYSEIEEEFLAVKYELFRDIYFGFNQKFALSKGEIFLDWIRELIEKKFYGEKYNKGNNLPVRFKDINKDLIIITTNLKDFSCQEFSNKETPDYEIALAIRISCCMPGLMNALEYNDKILVDGDLLKAKPMWSLSKNISSLDERILEIRLEGTYSEQDDKALNYANGIYSCITSTETDFVKNIYGKNDKYDYLVIDTGNILIIDFNCQQEKRQEILDIGYKKTLDYFKNEIVIKKKSIFEIYDKILNDFRKIQECMLRKRYKKIQTILSKMFVDFMTTKEYIDPQLLEMIIAYQKLCEKNIQTGLLGTSFCKDKNTLFVELRKILDDVTKRTKEIETYILKFSD